MKLLVEIEVEIPDGLNSGFVKAAIDDRLSRVPLAVSAPDDLRFLDLIVNDVTGNDYKAVVQAIDELRADEGSAVTIPSDNPDFNGQPDRIVDVVGGWTDWMEVRFGGDTLAEALKKAVSAKRCKESSLESDVIVMPVCPQCGNNRQVWVNQITRRVTCHRVGCHNKGGLEL